MNWYHFLKFALQTNHNAIQEILTLIGEGKRGDNSLISKWTQLKNTPNFANQCHNPTCFKLQKQIDDSLITTRENIVRGTYDNALAKLKNAYQYFQSLIGYTLKASGTFDPNVSQLIEIVKQMMQETEEQLEFIGYINNSPAITPVQETQKIEPSYIHQPQETWMG